MRVLFFSLLAASMFGAPIGNPAAPHVICKGFFIPKHVWANIRLGYEGDFIFDGEMKQTKQGSGSVDKFTQTTNSGTFTLDLLERLDLYAVFGSSKFCSKWRFQTPTDEIRNAEMETKHAFLWACGGRALLYSWGKWDLGVGGRYSASHNSLSWLTIDGSSVSTAGSRARWHQWQANMGVAYRIDLFTPYIGVDYLSVRNSLQRVPEPVANNDRHSNHFENKTPVGLYLGCTLSNRSYFMLNIEGRVIAEEALSVSGDFRF